MSLNDTPSAERVHISFFGNRNAGKSSLVNAFTGQNLAVVSDTLGTTTDPVKKAMELLPIGPVVVTDTPGYDDQGELGNKRIEKTRETLGRTDIAILVVDGQKGMDEHDHELLDLFKERHLSYLTVYNKCDLLHARGALGSKEMYVSAKTGENINELKEYIAHLPRPQERVLVHDLVNPGDLVVLVVPIDESAPKGRLILPQQMVIRDLLDYGCIPVVTREKELKATLASLKREPSLVITDSQAFGIIKDIVPENLPLTSFSILMARYKGSFAASYESLKTLDDLHDGDTVLIAEGCTHHRQCNDIGTIKLPLWLGRYTRKNLQIATSSGLSFPEDLTGFRMVIHCGGCMLNQKEMQRRIHQAKSQHVPITNYGMAIAYMNGILKRSLKVLGYDE